MRENTMIKSDNWAFNSAQVEEGLEMKISRVCVCVCVCVTQPHSQGPGLQILFLPVFLTKYLGFDTSARAKAETQKDK